jgi:hypothetical protein
MARLKLNGNVKKNGWYKGTSRLETNVMTYLRGISFTTYKWTEKKNGSCPAVGFYTGGAEPWHSITGKLIGYGN